MSKVTRHTARDAAADDECLDSVVVQSDNNYSLLKAWIVLFSSLIIIVV